MLLQINDLNSIIWNTTNVYFSFRSAKKALLRFWFCINPDSYKIPINKPIHYIQSSIVSRNQFELVCFGIFISDMYHTLRFSLQTNHIIRHLFIWMWLVRLERRPLPRDDVILSRGSVGRFLSILAHTRRTHICFTDNRLSMMMMMMVGYSRTPIVAVRTDFLFAHQEQCTTRIYIYIDT